MAHNSQDLIDFSDDIVTKEQTTTKIKNKLEDLQIKMLEEFLKTSKVEKQTLTFEQDEEFKRFFDKYESDYKIDEEVDTKHKVPDYSNKENSDSESPSCSRYFELPPSLLEEEFAGKNLLEDKREKEYSSYIEDEPKVLTPKLNEDQNFDEDLIDEVLIEKNIEINNLKANKADALKNHNFKFNNFDKNKIKSKDFDKKCNVTELETSNEYEDIMNEIIATNDIKCYGVKDVKNTNKIPEDQFKLKTKEEKEFIDTLVTKYNLTYLEAVKKVDKTFNKRSLLKSDLEKVNLTPGPTHYEKAIVLPKMMKQLEDRKLDKNKKVERKLILGGGYLINPNNLDTTKKDDKTLLKSQKVQNVCKVVNKEVESTSLESGHTVRSDSKILEPPILVMEDCNRERLIAFKTRRLFQNFIRTGNYFSEEF